jgi:hypothetical protein
MTIHDNLCTLDRVHLNDTESFYTDEQTEAINEMRKAIKKAAEIVDNDSLYVEIDDEMSKAQQSKRMETALYPFKKLGLV